MAHRGERGAFISLSRLRAIVPRGLRRIHSNLCRTTLRGERHHACTYGALSRVARTLRGGNSNFVGTV